MTSVSSRNETPRTERCCAAPGCANTVLAAPTGRPARPLLFRHLPVPSPSQAGGPTAGAISVEIDMGSASSRGRRPDHAWLVRLRRADQSVIVAIGLRRHAADRLAEQLDALLNHPNEPMEAS